MRKLISYILLFLLLSTLFNGVLMAAEKTEEKKETVHLRAGQLTYKKDKIIVSDNVRIIKGDIDLTAPEGEIKKEENYAFLSGGVNVKYADGKVNSEEMTAWLDENKYIFKEKVVLNHKPENKEEFDLQAPYLEMYTDDNSFIAKKGVIIDQQNRRLKGTEARYKDQNQVLNLTGDVYIEEDGDWIKSNKAVFYLGSEDEEFSAEGEVELEFELSD